MKFLSYFRVNVTTALYVCNAKATIISSVPFAAVVLLFMFSCVALYVSLLGNSLCVLSTPQDFCTSVAKALLCVRQFDIIYSG